MYKCQGYCSSCFLLFRHLHYWTKVPIHTELIKFVWFLFCLHLVFKFSFWLETSHKDKNFFAFSKTSVTYVIKQPLFITSISMFSITLLDWSAILTLEKDLAYSVAGRTTPLLKFGENQQNLVVVKMTVCTFKIDVMVAK